MGCVPSRDLTCFPRKTDREIVTPSGSSGPYGDPLPTDAQPTNEKPIDEKPVAESPAGESPADVTPAKEAPVPQCKSRCRKCFKRVFSRA
ncbi:hypothetical protein H4R21_001761 [Coemansia helicoidea]|uniref:Uncharacterized protein n=1 Tax=Coemansia helicoidea TaxID=1286919 RepID=A0ACC1LBA2_9FUNG|nr:hypothetical protein H4R21_001761 [Coemansia helicoidea]